MFIYFAGCRTLDDAKIRYYEKAKELHPDKSGDAEHFKALKAEYEEFKIVVKYTTIPEPVKVAPVKKSPVKKPPVEKIKKAPANRKKKILSAPAPVQKPVFKKPVEFPGEKVDEILVIASGLASGFNLFSKLFTGIASLFEDDVPGEIVETEKAL